MISRNDQHIQVFARGENVTSHLGASTHVSQHGLLLHPNCSSGNKIRLSASISLYFYTWHDIVPDPLGVSRKSPITEPLPFGTLAKTIPLSIIQTTRV